jgi:hypothetical protein
MNHRKLVQSVAQIFQEMGYVQVNGPALGRVQGTSNRGRNRREAVGGSTQEDHDRKAVGEAHLTQRPVGEAHLTQRPAGSTLAGDMMKQLEQGVLADRSVVALRRPGGIGVDLAILLSPESSFVHCKDESAPLSSTKDDVWKQAQWDTTTYLSSNGGHGTLAGEQRIKLELLSGLGVPCWVLPIGSWKGLDRAARVQLVQAQITSGANMIQGIP